MQVRPINATRMPDHTHAPRNNTLIHANNITSVNCSRNGTVNGPVKGGGGGGRGGRGLLGSGKEGPRGRGGADGDRISKVGLGV